MSASDVFETTVLCGVRDTSLDTNPVTGFGQVCLTRTGITHSQPHSTPLHKIKIFIIFVSRAPRSIYCFKLKNPVRKACIALSESKTFEHFILVTILGKQHMFLNKTLFSEELVLSLLFTRYCV